MACGVSESQKLRAFWGPGVALWLRHCATSRTVPESIPCGVTGDLFSVAPPDGTMCPGVDSPPENEYQGFLMG